MSVTAPRQKIEAHRGIVEGISRLPGGQRIITCSYDGSLRIWDLESDTQAGEPWRD